MASPRFTADTELMTATTAEGQAALPPRSAGVTRAALLSLLAVVLALPGVVLTAARVGPWELGSPWVQLLSGYPLTLVSTFAAVLAAVLIGRRRRVRLVALAGVVLLLAAQLSMVTPRLLSDGWNPLAANRAGPLGQGQAGGEQGRRLTVMALNVGGATLDAAAVLKAVNAHGVEILALPELSPVTLQRLEDAGIARLLPYRALDVDGANTGSGIFSVFALTKQKRVPGSESFQSGAVAAVPGIRQGMRLTAVHVESPRPGQVSGWREDLTELSRLQRAAPDGTPAVLLGDFNASLDHRGLRSLLNTGLSDAAAATGRGLWPTWPANSSAFPFVQIDHVLVSRELTVESFTTVSIPGTDHLAVVSGLSYRG